MIEMKHTMKVLKHSNYVLDGNIPKEIFCFGPKQFKDLYSMNS